MNNQEAHIKYLWQQFEAKKATPEEVNQLFKQFADPAHDAVSDAFLIQRMQEYKATVGDLADWETVMDGKTLAANAPATVITSHRTRFLKTTWFRYAAAIIILAGAGMLYYFLSPERSRSIPIAERSRGVDIRPGSTKAILTLADGSKIVLDKTTSNNLTQKDANNITTIDASRLSYNQRGKTTNNLKEAIGYNTVSTNTGNQYQIILADGSKVWLNAASSIKFPTTFTSNVRTVEVTGEAYLEIAKNAKQSFIVKTNSGEVQVLGTSFNIKTYENESFKTSLLEGSVKVNNQLLKPGQAYQNGKIINTDLTQDIAWKNGLFNFNRLPLKQAMNELARWYDVDIVYQGDVPRAGFYGEIVRELSLTELLRGLEGTIEGVKFKIEGRKIIVSAN